MKPPQNLITLPQFPTGFFRITLVFTMSVLLWFGYQSYEHKVQAERLKQDYLVYYQWSIINKYHEVLTMSAMAAAKTGDLHWEQRYQHDMPQMDRAIEIAYQLEADPQKKELYHQLKGISQALGAMDTQAFLLVHQGKIPEAQALLASSQYQIQSQTLSSYLKTLLTLRRERLEHSLKKADTMTHLSFWLVVASMFMLLSCWTLFIKGCRYWYTLLTQTTDRANNQAISTSQMNIQLNEAVVSMERKTLQQEMIAVLSQRALHGSDNLEDFLKETLIMTKELLQVDYVGFFTYLSKERLFYIRAGCGFSEQWISTLAFPEQTLPLELRALSSSEPIMLSAQDQNVLCVLPEQFIKLQIKSGLGVAVLGSQEPFGVISAYATSLDAFEQSDAYFIQSIANLIAIILENNSLNNASVKDQRPLKLVLT